MVQEQQTAAFGTLQKEIDAYFAAEPWRYELVRDRAEMDLAEAGLDERNLDFRVSVMMRADFFELHTADGKRKPKGKAYGALTAKNIAVLRALLFHSYDDRHPSYEAIREKAMCSKRPSLGHSGR